MAWKSGPGAGERVSRVGIAARLVIVLWCALVVCGNARSVQISESSLVSQRAEQNGNAGLTEAGTPSQRTEPQTSSSSAATSTDQFRLSPERYAKAVAYSRAGYRLYFVEVVWGIAALLLLLRLRIVARLRDFAERRSENRFIQALLFLPALLLLLDLLELPLWVHWHSLSLEYEQSVQGWGSWFLDHLKAEGLEIGLGLLIGISLFWLIRWKPRQWWLYFWFGAIPVALFLFFITPWFIAPLFNKFSPLQAKHPQLVSSIVKLTERAGAPIPPERMFLMEASAKTNQINAYVTGIGASKRVVIWDTAIQKTMPDELLFIVGHEMGHYVLGHVRKGFTLFLAGLLVALYVAYRALHWTLDRWGKSWNVYGQGDWAALAVLLLIFNVIDFMGTPIGMGFSRMQEHEADVYGLEVIHGVVPNSGEVAAHAFQVMGELDLADPNPSEFITFWLYSHPPLGDRLIFAHSYDPWSKGESPKFVK